MKMKKILWLTGVVMLWSMTMGDDKLTPLQYIEQYKLLAIKEMHRTGIPASITMAQGLLESGNGNSRLAKEGNNHFGIKCKKNWNGKTIIEDDDELGECFRAYDSAYQSYIDHSEFLMANVRYAFLFEYPRTDYVNWAHGLKKAGYATNPKYPELLITIIERHELYKLDYITLDDLEEKKEEQKPIIEEKVTAKNNIPVAQALPGEDIVGIAKRNAMGAWQIRRYNDLPKDYVLKPGETVYLKPKKRSGLVPYHVVEPGETMWDISQDHGIKLKQLYWKNKLNRRNGEQPAPGEVLYLQEKNPNKISLKNESEELPLKQEEPVIIPEKKDDHPKKPEETQPPKPEEKKEEKNEEPVDTVKAEVIPEKPLLEHHDPSNAFHLHTVQAGETLFSLSKKYSVSVEQLRELNGLADYSIKVGQELIINGEAKEDKPDYESTTYVHTVKTGETLYSISRKYNISVADLKEFNQMESDQVSIGQKIKLVKGNGEKKEVTTNEAPVKHTVTKGDTLFSISRKYQVSVSELRKLNNLESDILSIGMVIQLR